MERRPPPGCSYEREASGRRNERRKRNKSCGGVFAGFIMFNLASVSPGWSKDGERVRGKGFKKTQFCKNGAFYIR
jgi:hypothetical protein